MDWQLIKKRHAGRTLVEMIGLTAFGTLLLIAAQYFPDIPVGGGESMAALAPALFIVPFFLGSLAGRRGALSARVTTVSVLAVPFLFSEGYWLFHPSCLLNPQVVAALLVFALGGWAGHQSVSNLEWSSLASAQSDGSGGRQNVQ